MYARVRLTTERHPRALVVPRNALVDASGGRGVFVPVKREGPAPGAAGAGRGPAMQARFVPLKTGIQEGDLVEVLEGLREGDAIVTTGATAVQDGDALVLGGPGGPGRPSGGPPNARRTE
jgi:membrane fusion protein, multidrug efflux system